MENKEIKAKLKAIIKAEKHGNSLKKDVAKEWLNNVDEYENGEEWIKDLMNGGCSSGFIGKLIYTKDAQKYYDKHYDAVEDIISDLEESIGQSIDASNKSKIDHKTFRAWVAFEEMARNISQEIDIEA